MKNPTSGASRGTSSDMGEVPMPMPLSSGMQNGRASPISTQQGSSYTQDDAEKFARRIRNALNIAFAHSTHQSKAWVIDQMVRALHPDENTYLEWVREWEGEKDSEGNKYEDTWNEGTAP